MQFYEFHKKKKPSRHVNLSYNAQLLSLLYTKADPCFTLHISIHKCTVVPSCTT